MMNTFMREKELLIIAGFFIFIAMLLIFFTLVFTQHFNEVHHTLYIYIYSGVAILFIVLVFRYVYSIVFHYNKRINRVEDSLEQTLSRLEYAINGTGDGLWDWNLVTHEVYFSPKWKEMMGYTDDELPSEFSSWEDNVHPDDLERTVQDILKTQEKPGVPYEGIHRLKHKNGSWVWILDRGQTLFDGEGKAVRMVGFHTDITKTKEQEFRIKELSALLHNTINSFENLIFVKNNNFEYIEFNEAFERFTGLSKEDLQGKNDYDIFSKEVADGFRQRDQEMLRSGKTQENYEWVTYPDGVKEYLLTSKSPLHDAHGNVLGVVGNSFKMTKQKRLEEKLKTQEEVMIAQSRHAAMGEMISMIAHQWRQPISVISMDANNILVDIALEQLDEKSLENVANGIVKQTQELSKTINDFKDFFKPDKVKEESFLVDIVNDALGVIGKSLANNNIEITVDIAPNISIHTYARELMQVIINIINNAKEALTEQELEKKNVTLSTVETDESVSLKISDNGGGIPKEIMANIFDPYFTTKGERNGTGLGLYMSKTIIEKHLHGLISVSNLNGGACFDINLLKHKKND